jgi:WD40 repeat protein
VRALCADTALAIGATATLRGRVVDRYGNSRSDVPVVTASTGNAIALNASTDVVTAREMGTQWLFMRYLQTPADSTMVRVLPAGRLVVWSPSERAVRLVNVDGSATRTLVTGVASNLGAFPHFDGLRKNITLHNGSAADGGVPNSVIVIDTTGSPRRDLGPGVGFATVVATRQLADGTLLVVGNTVADTSCAGLALFRVASDNSLTCLTTLPGLSAEYGAADISHDGTRVAYIGSDASIPNSSSFELRILNVATGAKTVLEPVATSPRWSSGDDRVAYLVPRPGAYVFGAIDGTAMIISADGTGRRSLGNFVFSPGLAWSPDGTYIVGRNSGSPDIALRVIRISDGANVLLRFRTTAGATADYYQPDWR